MSPHCGHHCDPLRPPLLTRTPLPQPLGVLAVNSSQLLPPLNLGGGCAQPVADTGCRWGLGGVQKDIPLPQDGAICIPEFSGETRWESVYGRAPSRCPIPCCPHSSRTHFQGNSHLRLCFCGVRPKTQLLCSPYITLSTPQSFSTRENLLLPKGGETGKG